MNSNGDPPQQSEDERPGIIAPAPLIFGAVFLIAMILHLAFTRTLPTNVTTEFIVGVILVSVALALSAWSLFVMHRAGTSPNPSQPTVALVTKGPFRFSRHPIYLAHVIGYLGVTFLVNSLWPLVLLPVAVAVLEAGVVRREERYLGRRFGDEYRRYRSSVRRWI
ncbi:MAG: isoprenylcysteine carboxylmethyltransferase family protein [Dehalococcoidia bacterium]